MGQPPPPGPPGGKVPAPVGPAWDVGSGRRARNGPGRDPYLPGLNRPKPEDVQEKGRTLPLLTPRSAWKEK